MITTGYITNDEFIASNYYCLFTECCTLTGSTDALITELIICATSLIDNYLGFSLWEQERKDRFVGSNRNIYFTKYTPIKEILSLTWNERNTPSCTGDMTTGSVFYELDEGILTSDYRFCRYKKYILKYVAGFLEIPEDIKTATKILVANLSQQIDTGNINNPEMNQSMGKLDNVLTYGIGTSGLLKNYLIKDMNDIKNLPTSVYPILNKYKGSKLT